MASKEIAGVKISELDIGDEINFELSCMMIATGAEYDEGGNSILKSYAVDLNDSESPILDTEALKTLKSGAISTSDAHTDEKLLGYVTKEYEPEPGYKGLSTNDFTDQYKQALDNIDWTNVTLRPTALNNKEFIVLTTGEIWLNEHGIDPDRIDTSIWKLVQQSDIDLWNSKQNALTEVQLDAVNSGITSTKVALYDSYATEKQDKLTDAQLAAVNSGITPAHVSRCESHIQNTVVHVTEANKTSWNNKVSRINAGNNVNVTSNSDGSVTIGFNAEGVVLAGGTIQIPIGTIVPFCGSSSPDGFLLCNGDAISRTTYSELFGVIGESFGKGNGTTTFNLPKLDDDRYLCGSNKVIGTKLDPKVPAHTHVMTHSHGMGNHTHGIDHNHLIGNHVHSINHTQKSEDSFRTVGTVRVLRGGTDEETSVQINVPNDLSSEARDTTFNGSSGQGGASTVEFTGQSGTSSGNTDQFTGNTQGASDSKYSGTEVTPKSLVIHYYIKAKQSSSDIVVDASLSSTSQNPVQNKVVTAALDSKYSRGPNIELNSGSSNISSATGGWIDFHFGGNTGDYTSRIIESESGRLKVFDYISVDKDPVKDGDLTRKRYVDTQISAASNTANGKVSKVGDTMSGPLKFSVSGGINSPNIQGTGDCQYLRLSSGSTENAGASILLVNSKYNYNGNTGCYFNINTGTTDGTSAGYVLSGRTSDGVLSWSGSTIRATNFDGTATRAKWADLAEYYLMDNTYPVGTLVCFGGKAEMTVAKDLVNAVISEKPAVVMNTAIAKKKNAQPVALMGRVKVRVLGKVKKFDLIGLDPKHPGVAIKVENKDLAIGRVLKGKTKTEEGLVLCSVKMEY
jgi:microcystin-dependent protein